jgi:ribosomal protein S18 acetylase RimI-like enzyme
MLKNQIMTENKNPCIVLRVAEFSDATAIAQLLHDAFVGYQHLYTKKAFAATVLGVYKIKERIYNKRTWVVLVDGVINATISLIPADDTLYIKSVAVAPDARRKGLGKGMMKHAENVAVKRKFRYMELTTTHFLSEAIKLYENFGFEHRGQKDLYGTPLMRMVKDLKSAVISQNKKQLALK